MLRRLALAATIYGIGTQAVGAIYYMPDTVPQSPYWHSKLWQILFQAGSGPKVIIAITAVGMVAAICWPRRRAHQSVGPLVALAHRAGREHRLRGGLSVTHLARGVPRAGV